MKSLSSKYLLDVVVFLSGAILMSLELTASRVLAPHVGTSIVIWTILIGIVLGGLSLGYLLGGIWADKKSTYSDLSLIILVAGISVALISITESFLFSLPIFSSAHIVTQIIIATTVLFFVPSMFLGMVSPYAAKLRLSALSTSGRTVGRLSAYSTLGSITGTFFTGLYLMAVLGNREILYLLAFLLTLLSLITYSHKYGALKLCFTIFLVVAIVYPLSYDSPRTLFQGNTQYSYVKIFMADHGVNNKVKILQLNKEYHSGMYLEDTSLAFQYTKFYYLAEYFSPHVQNALMLGGGAYSWPKEFLKKYPSARIDVVEIDPALTPLAKKYFNLKDSPRLSIYHEDARTFLNNNQVRYDAVYGDTFQSYYSIPYQLTTKEAMTQIFNSLTDDGVFIVNIVGSLEGANSRFLRAEYKTVATVFPKVKVFPVRSLEETSFMQNIILVALKNPENKSSDTELYEEFLRMEYRGELGSDDPILTDNYAPVDHYMASLFL